MLDAVSEPAAIDKSPRRLTAPELLDETLDRPAAVAEIGDVRTRIGYPAE